MQRQLRKRKKVNALPTDQPTDQPTDRLTDRRTDTVEYRVAFTRLKIYFRSKKERERMKEKLILISSINIANSDKEKNMIKVRKTPSHKCRWEMSLNENHRCLHANKDIF